MFPISEFLSRNDDIKLACFTQFEPILHSVETSVNIWTDYFVKIYLPFFEVLELLGVFSRRLDVLVKLFELFSENERIHEFIGVMIYQVLT